MSKKSNYIYLFHYLGNRDLKIKNAWVEDLKESINKEREINKKKFREITKKIYEEISQKNAIEIAENLNFEILKNELSYFKDFKENIEEIKLILIYTNQQNEYRKSDTLYVFKILKKLEECNLLKKVLEYDKSKIIIEGLEIEEAKDEKLLFDKVFKKLNQIKEENKKGKKEVFLFTSGGMPEFKVISSYLLFFKFHYKGINIHRKEITEDNRIKHKDYVIEIFLKTLLEKGLVDFVNITYEMKFFREDLFGKYKEIMEYLIPYLYARINQTSYSKDKIEKLKNMLEEKRISINDCYLKLEESSLKNILSLIQLFILFVNEGKSTNASLLYTAILDELKNHINEKIKNWGLNYDNKTKFYLKKGSREELVYLESDSPYSLVAKIYSIKNKETVFYKKIIDEFFIVKEEGKKVIINEKYQNIRNYRNKLVHGEITKAMNEIGDKTLKQKLEEIKNIFIKIYEELGKNQFIDCFEEYKKLIFNSF